MITAFPKEYAGISIEVPQQLVSPHTDNRGQRGTGQIRDKVKEDENGIGIAEEVGVRRQARGGRGGKETGRILILP